MTEEQTYDVVAKYPGFELRRYAEHVVAETRVTGSFEGVGTTSFRRLVGYIGGRNSESQKLAMTVPAQTAAALRFSGRWSRGRYEEHARRLTAALETAGLTGDGPLRFARFDPPGTPWFRRRNEVVVPVRD